jgi:stress response protein YsnF
MRAGAAGTSEQTEQVIPIAKEELAVGKRASERRYRVRTYVVETPVEEQVRLRDERVIVERRPASSEVTSGAGAMQEREFEVTERHEEPVVEKRARQVEEVVVRREANERVETVRDTVRETKVDVDKEPADHRVDVGGANPQNRNS